MIAAIACSRARNNKAKRRNLLPENSSITNGRIQKSPLITHVNHEPEIQHSSSMPLVRVINNHSILTQEPLAIIGDDNNDNMFKTSNGYCNSTERDNRHFSIKVNHTEDRNFITKSDQLILSEGYLEFYQPDIESGLIRPLNLRADTSKPSRTSGRLHSSKPVNLN